MVLSLSTQGYQSILLSVSMHQNKPVKQSDMLSFSFTPSSSSVSVPSLAQPRFCDFFLFISPPALSPSQSLIAPVSSCFHLSSPLAPVPSSLLSSSLHFTVLGTSTWIQFKSYPEKREQQQDFVDGNLIHGEQGVCNAAYVPGSCLIAFGFVQIWLLLTCRESKNYTERDSWVVFHNVL